MPLYVDTISEWTIEESGKKNLWLCILHVKYHTNELILWNEMEKMY